jgi:hypothetical protein
MNPAITMLIAYVRCLQQSATSSSPPPPSSSLGSSYDNSSNHGGAIVIEPWAHATMGLWGQAVGLFVCIIYTVMYIPREAKYWPATFK